MLALVTLIASAILIGAFVQAHESNSIVKANLGCGFHASALATDSSLKNESSPVGQISSGQLRAGEDLPAALLTWFGDAFVDQQGKGCWWTPPSYVLQCDRNQPPDHGFKIGCDGVISFNGQNIFWECRTGDGNQTNIYLQSGGPQCFNVRLIADGCTDPAACDQPTSTNHPSGVPMSSLSPDPLGGAGPGGISVTPFTSLPTPTSPTTNVPASSPMPSTSSPISCIPDLSSPSLIPPKILVPLDHSQPRKPWGPSQYGQVTRNASTIFDFDMPLDTSGKTCIAFFSFRAPVSHDGSENGYYFEYSRTGGDGVVNFARLQGPAPADSSWATVPSVNREFGQAKARENMDDVVLEQGPCGTASRGYLVGEGVTGQGQQADTCLIWPQGAGSSRIGVYMMSC